MKIEICPVCGSPIEYMELTTLPPVPVKQCPSCGWRWEGKPEKTEYFPIESEAIIGWRDPPGFFDCRPSTLSSIQEAGEPLTVEQLKQMDGKPVWVEFIGHPDGTPIEPLWMLVNCREKRLVTDVEYVDWIFEGWFAYPYPPAHIDREAWTAKWIEDGDCEHKPHRIRDVKKWRKYKCSKCGYKAGRSNSRNYCPSCGRAMTPEAWAELERRLRG